MGCTSSTQVITDPVTGETKTKKKNGGAYPGQRGQQHAAYQPPASAFVNGQATAHFVSYGGGNALTLMQPDGSTKPQHGGHASKLVKVTLPPGVVAGQTIHVKAPDGRLNEIIVPNGFGPGSTFTVEFAPPNEVPTQPYEKIPAEEAGAMNNTRPSAPYATAPISSSVEPIPAPVSGDDGFASGFNNPDWTPSKTTPVYASAIPTTHDPEIEIYPTTQAVPVASAGPYATAKPY
ncbi:expressed unknown protein [Seminavis robusta]|uniref:Uncharacterized protein n=1 Tax=Seminavis robusta TaxID=568900 RepID=A0A9N8ECE7_9STRA|nr:expressed unknown protein [Seminavis robusta]|eukprot:Sro968_g226010.1 n/a (234) ;mRNA; r:18069-18874